ncbi:MAG: DNA-binding protein [Acidimicrobiia bacterium]|nr:MAG: DNA-binding protein [Acidimicrobiia bacterium]
MSSNQTREDGPAARLGQAIRAQRAGRFSIHELAKAAGVSVGVLSQIEQGRGNPSFKTLQKIAQALGIRIGDLVEAATDESPGPMVVRRHERMRLQFGSEGLVYELLTPNLRGRLEMLQTSIPPGFSNRDNPFQHDGEECVLVLEGNLYVSVGGQEHRLSTGDSVTYDPARPHWWENRDHIEAVVVGAVTPPTF